jgi:hypothetical protein
VVRIEGVIVINRPVDEVFDIDFVAEERNEPRYNLRMVCADLISTGPIGPGTRFRSESRAMGRTVEMVIDFTAPERPRRLASSTHSSAMGIQETLSFDRVQ